MAQFSTTAFGQQITVSFAPTTRVATMALSVLPAPMPDQLPKRRSLRTDTATRRCIRFGGVIGAPGSGRNA